MKKLNNKGFSLIELLIAFTAITILSFAVFRTIISIQRRQQINIANNDYVIFQSSLNSMIQKDFANNVIEAIEYCGRNCYEIKYIGKGAKTLSIDINKNTISYGGIKYKLPKTFLFYRDIAQDEENLTSIDEGLNDSMILFRIPIDSTLLDQELDVLYIYQFDSRVNPVRPNI